MKITKENIQQISNEITKFLSKSFINLHYMDSNFNYILFNKNEKKCYILHDEVSFSIFTNNHCGFRINIGSEIEIFDDFIFIKSLYNGNNFQKIHLNII